MERHDLGVYRNLGNSLALFHARAEIGPHSLPHAAGFAEDLSQVEFVDSNAATGACPLYVHPAKRAELAKLAFDGPFLDRPEAGDLGPTHREFVGLPVIARGDQHHETQHELLPMLVGGQGSDAEGR